MKPNLEWTSVEEDHLRAHPYYNSLPPENCIVISSFEDLSYFRQSSIQWATMHCGRLTTSKAASVLGIYEPKAAKFLGIPRSLSGGHKANGAYEHLCGHPAFDSLNSAKEVLMEKNIVSRYDYDSKLESQSRKLWRPWRNGSNWRAQVWTHNYNSWYESCSDIHSSHGIRMFWGSVHEPTAILVAVNYFSFHTHACVSECGMLSGEALFDYDLTENQTTLLQRLYEIGCPIGASPDGLIHHSDGSVEILEVKNHCPFRTNRQGEVYIFDQFPTEEVLIWTIPQIQLEMFCVGPHCKSAILVRLTATKGAIISRIYRDDDFIEKMLERFILFYETFVQKNSAPPKDFSFGDMENFLISMQTIASNSTLVARIPHGQIQRKRSEGRVPLIV